MKDRPDVSVLLHPSVSWSFIPLWATARRRNNNKSSKGNEVYWAHHAPRGWTLLAFRSLQSNLQISNVHKLISLSCNIRVNSLNCRSDKRYLMTLNSASGNLDESQKHNAQTVRTIIKIVLVFSASLSELKFWCTLHIFKVSHVSCFAHAQCSHRHHHPP